MTTLSATEPPKHSGPCSVSYPCDNCEAWYRASEDRADAEVVKSREQVAALTQAVQALEQERDALLRERKDAVDETVELEQAVQAQGQALKATNQQPLGSRHSLRPSG